MVTMCNRPHWFQKLLFQISDLDACFPIIIISNLIINIYIYIEVGTSRYLYRGIYEYRYIYIYVLENQLRATRLKLLDFDGFRNWIHASKFLTWRVKS